ncbi:CheF family chemotaxis protein [Halomicrobium sp. LC1Hm]|uniref:CheF family chemotaxis protein n=1 Tax=Halomicrobium sp. LC1Hm TaxID=2610902 RepID=UPI001298582C|nr:CheF family chemotaxis protein [Halomicrobium sp. LC1Hm]QGA83815.1 Chemotaxis protein CheF [Halomicrobium sp. LC1Hm]
MSDGEQKLADAKGKFVQVVKDGRKRNDIDWRAGRIILSNKRLVLVSNEGKRTIPLSKIASITGRDNVNKAIAKVSGYLSLQVGPNVTLIAPQDIEAFEAKLYSALLDQTVVLVKHPAVEGGVVRDTEWEKGRLKIDGDSVDLAIASGSFVELEVEDVGSAELETKTVMDSQRRVAEIEHTIEGTSVETHVSGSKSDVSVLASFVRRGEQAGEVDVELSKEENEVLMALYTGVSPFQIPDFVGMEIEQVEEIYDRLIEYGILEPVRTRREVQLEARGRSIAGEAVDDQ